MRKLYHVILHNNNTMETVHFRAIETVWKQCESWKCQVSVPIPRTLINVLEFKYNDQTIFEEMRVHNSVPVYKLKFQRILLPKRSRNRYWYVGR